MHTQDVAEANIEKIGQLFPNCLTERLNENGQPETAIDFDKLKQELSKEIVEGNQERYQFTWPGKREAMRLANTPTNMTLRPDRESSVDFDNTENLYIEGDNLEVLKLLRENYLGKVKMIYIDPPYNTGNDFVYEDDFSQTAGEFKDKSGMFDENGNMLLDNYHLNAASEGKFHTKWLNEMYPRLKVARDLLQDDGVIFVSIDDNEVENLKKLCSEIFGGGNFIGQLILKTATDNNPSQINTEHEYMVCFARNKSQQKNWARRSEAAMRIIEQYNKLKVANNNTEVIQSKLRQWIKAHKDELPQVSHYNNVDVKGIYSSSSNSSNPHPGGYMYDVIHPVTGKPCPKPANGWRWPQNTFEKYEKSGDVEWGLDHTTQPHIKKRIETSVEYLRSLIYEDNRATTKMVADLFDGHKVFDNPKPVNVIANIIEFVSDKDSLILDFFSGSATTAHAVMKQNFVDGGTRKFILVQIPESTPEKSDARKAGYNNLCQIGEERIRRAAKKILEEQKAKQGEADLFTQQEPEHKLDTGFRVLKLDTSNMQDVYYKPEDFSENTLFEDNVKPGRTSEDLLFQVMLECNLPLSAKIEKKTIAGKEVFNVNDGYLLACFDEDVNETVITEVAKQKPYYFIMRDKSLSSDQVADNFEQIFNAYSKDTIRRIL